MAASRGEICPPPRWRAFTALPIPLLENGSKVQTKSTVLAAITAGTFSLDRAQGYYPEPNVLGGI